VVFFKYFIATERSVTWDVSEKKMFQETVATTLLSKQLVD